MRAMCKILAIFCAVALFLTGCLPVFGASASSAADEMTDWDRYHLEVWCDSGRVPIAEYSTESLEEYVRTHYVPSVTVEDRNRKFYLVNFEEDYFASISESISFYEFKEGSFHACKDENGKTVDKPEDLEPGCYLMKIRIWNMVFDVLYSCDCYLQIIIPGGESEPSWPAPTPTARPESDPVPDDLITSDGEWITPLPEFRSAPTPEPTPIPIPTPSPTPSPTPGPYWADYPPISVTTSAAMQAENDCWLLYGSAVDEVEIHITGGMLYLEVSVRNDKGDKFNLSLGEGGILKGLSELDDGEYTLDIYSVPEVAPVCRKMIIDRSR